MPLPEGSARGPPCYAIAHYPQYFAVIAHNIEQHCGFDFAIYHEESYIIPGVFYPQFGSYWLKLNSVCQDQSKSFTMRPWLRMWLNLLAQ